MKVLIFPTGAAERVAAEVRDVLTINPSAVLGLATGSTMEPVYAQLIAWHRVGRVSFSRARSFNLDEYIGLRPEQPQSFHSDMARMLFDHVDMAPGAARLPRGDAPDPQAEAEAYDAAIAAAGGIDLQLLGIGTNGHLGFNEPTSSLSSRTRIKTLTRSTREANARFFAQPEQVPQYSITMGIATILEARHCLLLATGASKAEAVAQMVEGPLSASCPASALQMHRRATIVLDEAAAAGLRLRDYYETVHPQGREAEL